MGFIENLAKGFVRSAVNQVGRDTGKVFSNKIYGDAHATPIRNVSNSNGTYIDDTTNQPLSNEEFYERLNKEGYRISFFTTNPFLKIFYYYLGMVVALIIASCDGGYWSLLPSAILLLCAALKLLSYRTNMPIYQLKDMPTYASDRRYRDGKRYIGHSRQKLEYYINPTERFKSINVIIFILYLLLGIMMYIPAYISIQGTEYQSPLWTIFMLSPIIIIISMHVIIRLVGNSK